ncbi:glycosyltransferase [Demequina sp. TTPB684]|uniref:glycosyltransferase n=1 Tax=unclassified Demequina TaxID=2620311 RepID=UPI001CF27630|nr:MULTISPECIES: glycosyltransferase [unclassified Demequina]MCB2412433.1 glycosyltransferase [Demequina sp. TTPB684]UPU87411.1 glycosyltransferase [Demequina sp. TMPB413]
MNNPTHRRLVIVVRADPVICGHSGEARNLAEVALTRGFDDVSIVTWPLERLEQAGLPLKPMDTVLPYSPGITVERPGPVGGYKIPDGRYQAGMVGRLVELFTDGVPTVCLSLYLHPHTTAVDQALRIARATGKPVRVTTIAEAVGSDVTEAVRSAVEHGEMGAAAALLATYLGQDHCVAVSHYTKRVIVESAQQVDLLFGTSFAEQCESRIGISYPAIDTSAYLNLDPSTTAKVLSERGLDHGRYVLYLSRLQKAKGVEDLIKGFAASEACSDRTLVVAGRGPDLDHFKDVAHASTASGRIRFLEDVGDEEKPHLMAACAAYVLPSRPSPEFTETFGIALVEKMLAGGGPVITCDTGGILEAVGDTAMVVPVNDPGAIGVALNVAVGGLDFTDREWWQTRAREHAMQFDRENVFDRLFARVTINTAETPLVANASRVRIAAAPDGFRAA